MMEPDWILGAVGGLMIGSAAAMYLLVNGRILGASGIIGELVDRSGLASASERLSFIAGLVVVPALIAMAFGPGQTHLTDNLAVIVVAGLLVGVGTRMANGCTSGHGVCGMSRLSRRSISATLFYLLGGGLAVLVFRHLLGVI